MDQVSANDLVLTDRSNDQFHKFTGWCIYNLCFLLLLRIDNVHELSHDELKCQVYDTEDVELF